MVIYHSSHRTPAQVSSSTSGASEHLRKERRFCSCASWPGGEGRLGSWCAAGILIYVEFCSGVTWSIDCEVCCIPVLGEGGVTQVWVPREGSAKWLWSSRVGVWQWLSTRQDWSCGWGFRSPQLAELDRQRWLPLTWLGEKNILKNHKNITLSATNFLCRKDYIFPCHRKKFSQRSVHYCFYKSYSFTQ